MEKAVNDYTRAGHWFALATVTGVASAVLSPSLITLLVSVVTGYLAYHYYNLGQVES